MNNVATMAIGLNNKKQTNKQASKQSKANQTKLTNKLTMVSTAVREEQQSIDGEQATKSKWPTTDNNHYNYNGTNVIDMHSQNKHIYAVAYSTYLLSYSITTVFAALKPPKQLTYAQVMSYHKIATPWLLIPPCNSPLPRLAFQGVDAQQPSTRIHPVMLSVLSFRPQGFSNRPHSVLAAALLLMGRSIISQGDYHEPSNEYSSPWSILDIYSLMFNLREASIVHHAPWASAGGVEMGKLC